MNNKAIVTLAYGDNYINSWKKNCETNWTEYCRKHGYDLILIDRPLDTSERAQKRSPSWQKLLILSQDFSAQYQRIVWVDSDILINNHTAPCISAGVPLDKVGAAEMFCYSGEAGRRALARMYDFWKLAVVNPEPEDYYTRYELPRGFSKVVQAGVLVLSPNHHRALVEKVYHEYEEKGGAEWHYEMRPLSYELLSAGAVHWIDPRFNVLWFDDIFLHYPFLLNPPTSNGAVSKAATKIASKLGGCSRASVRRACLTASFLNSYFFHFGGSEIADMELLNTSVNSWQECRL